MGEIFKNYGEFLNEGLFPDSIKNLTKRAISAVKKFTGRGGGFLNSLVYQALGKKSKDGEPGTIPNGVIIFPSKYDKEQLKAAGIPIEDPVLDDGGKTEFEEVYEGVVPLDFPNTKAGVKNVGYEELIKVIKAAIETDPEMEEADPLMIWGAPGIGKTAIVKTIQKEIYGGRMIDIQLTTYAPEDFFLPAQKLGVEGALKKLRSTRIPQEWFPIYHESEGEAGDAEANGPDGQGGIIFLDELSRAKEAIRNICLKLVLERELDGGWKIGSRWKIIAASNRQEDDETNTAAFGSALANRFNQVNFTPTVKDFSKYALAKKSRTGKDLYDPRIISFLNWTKGQEFFHKMDPDAGSSVFPSPRSWERFAKAWYNLKIEAERAGKQVNPDDIDLALKKSVGNEAADMFMGYYKLSTQIDLDKLKLVYTEPDQAPLPPKNMSGRYELDASHILAAAIAYEHRTRKLDLTEVENVVKYAVKVNDATVAMQIMQALLDIHPYINADKNTNPESMIDGYFKIMAALFLPKYPGSAKDIEKLNKEAASSKPTSFTQNKPEEPTEPTEPTEVSETDQIKSKIFERYGKHV